MDKVKITPPVSYTSSRPVSSCQRSSISHLMSVLGASAFNYFEILLSVVKLECIFWKTRGVICIGGSKGGARDAPPPRGSKFFHFHAVFGKNLKNNSNFGSWRTPLGENPGSATDLLGWFVSLWWINHTYSLLELAAQKRNISILNYTLLWCSQRPAPRRYISFYLNTIHCTNVIFMLISVG